MSEQIFNTRIVHKHDTEANWSKAVNFIPKQGEIIVYDIDSTYTYERFKIGDGETLVNSLPFVDDALRSSLESQIKEVDNKVIAVSNLVGNESVSNQISEALLNSQADWNQIDNTQPDFIKNKPDEDDAIELLIEMNIVEPVVSENGSIYTDENDAIYTII